MGQSFLPATHKHATGLERFAPNIRRMAALGNNPSIDTTSTPETVWPGGGLYPFQATAQSLEVVSASAADAAAGTGARTVVMTLLDATYAESTLTVTLNGLTAVAITGGPYLRINFFIVLTAGSGATNAGDLSVRVAGGGTTIGLIQAGTSFMRQAVFTVPLGYTLNVEQYHSSMPRSTGTATTASLTDDIRTVDGPTYLPFEFAISSARGYNMIPVEPSYILAEKTDLSLRCIAVSNNSTNLTAALIGTLYKTVLI